MAVGLLLCLSCGEAVKPARQASSDHAEIGAASGPDGGTRVCLGTALANPCYPGEGGELRGVCDQLAVRPQDKGYRVEEVSAPVFPFSCRLFDI